LPLVYVADPFSSLARFYLRFVAELTMLVAFTAMEMWAVVLARLRASRIALWAQAVRAGVGCERPLTVPFAAHALADIATARSPSLNRRVSLSRN